MPRAWGRWIRTPLPISLHLNHTVLLRAAFDVEDRASVRALRLRKYTFRNNGRWGRYTRNVEVATDNSVYNNGVGLMLEMR